MFFQSAFSQSKSEYLKNNRFDLLKSNFEFPQKNFKIIGFGAYHGSQETEIVENILLENLIKKIVLNITYQKQILELHIISISI